MNQLAQDVTNPMMDVSRVRCVDAVQPDVWKLSKPA